LIKNLINKCLFRFFPIIGHILRYHGLINCDYRISKELDFRTKKANSFIKNKIINSRIILEYGSGNSTVFANNIGKKIYTVESDKNFYEFLKKKVNKNFYFVDFGYVYFYSVPCFQFLRKKKLKEKAIIYSKKILNTLEKKKIFPDFILIDGRHRVLCALQVYEFLFKHNLKNTVVALDDYKYRKDYHILKKFFKITLIKDIGIIQPKKNKIETKLFIEKYSKIFG
tara:strand:- start:501 stop:1178 length:678 start_codon:yes stop_codon:yes gene_type:complete